MFKTCGESTKSRNRMPSVTQFDELLQEIGEDARQHWQGAVLSNTGSRRSTDEGADDYAMRVHHAGAVRGKIVNVAANRAERMSDYGNKKRVEQVH